MKTLACLGGGLLAAYLVLVAVLQTLDRGAAAACGVDFTLPAVACRMGSVGLMLALVPLAGVLGYRATRKVIGR